MTCRQSDSSSKDMYSKPQSRLNQQIKCESTDEGCPVMEESGTVCGETNSLGVFQEFRQVYDDCLKKLEGNEDGNAILRKLAPFKKLIDDLWEQNTMLVETVEELEQEATCKVTKLQDRLNKSCQKVCEYQEDIKSLVLIIQNFIETGVFNATGFKFNTFCPASVFGTCRNSCSELYPIEERESEVSCGKSSSFLENSSSQDDCTISEEKIGMKCVVCVTNPSEALSSKGLPCNRNSVNNNFSKRLLNQNGPNQFFESPYLDEEHFFNNYNHKNKFENIGTEKTDCQGSAQSININFNIKRDEIFDRSDCCCDCSCVLNVPHSSDC